MSNERITYIDRPYSATRGQKLKAKGGGKPTKNQGGFWGVLG